MTDHLLCVGLSRVVQKAQRSGRDSGQTVPGTIRAAQGCKGGPRVEGQMPSPATDVRGLLTGPDLGLLFTSPPGSQASFSSLCSLGSFL